MMSYEQAQAFWEQTQGMNEEDRTRQVVIGEWTLEVVPCTEAEMDPRTWSELRLKWANTPVRRASLNYPLQKDEFLFMLGQLAGRQRMFQRLLESALRIE
jgi:hypothetical protein